MPANEHRDILVGTFNTPSIYSLRFTPPSTFQILHRNNALGSHSWLALSPSRDNLYATAWLEPPSIASYSITKSPETGARVSYLNQKAVKSRSGYTCASNTHVYSAGGPSGEAFAVDSRDGSIGDLVQELDFMETDGNDSKTVDCPHGDFGGLRHGSHSVDLSPDGKQLHVADIGRNCVWSFAIDNNVRKQQESGQHLLRRQKNVATRSNDGPRHASVHPNNKVVYVVQEHTSMVDAFTVDDHDATVLGFRHGASILPLAKNAADFWADEVRISHILDMESHAPKYLWASTRGLHPHVKGYVAIYALDMDGLLIGGSDAQALHIWETPTSGGIANAIEPGLVFNEVEYAMLTDSEQGYVFALGWDGKQIREVARLKFEEENVEGGVVKAATAVWL